jgi:GNAT superfamily N-acetyltransferase
MGGSVEIVPVGAEDVRRALRVVAAGEGADIASEMRVEAMEATARAAAGPVIAWWALSSGRAAAAAAVLPGPGGTGMIFFTQPEVRGVRREWLVAAVAGAARQALAGDLAFVQSLAAPWRKAPMEVLAAAGFERLAELVYLRREVTRGDGRGEDAGVGWTHVGECGEAELARLLLLTYEDSIDCPRLYGLRTIEQTIAGHKGLGPHHSEWWWIATVQGRPAGCILLCESAASSGCIEVAYMGVAAEFRRRGLGRRMLRRAAAMACRQGREALTVAVDAANTGAATLYADEGYREIDRRVAFLLAP